MLQSSRTVRCRPNRARFRCKRDRERPPVLQAARTAFGSAFCAPQSFASPHHRQRRWRRVADSLHARKIKSHSRFVVVSRLRHKVKSHMGALCALFCANCRGESGAAVALQGTRDACSVGILNFERQIRNEIQF